MKLNKCGFHWTIDYRESKNYETQAVVLGVACG